MMLSPWPWRIAALLLVCEVISYGLSLFSVIPRPTTAVAHWTVFATVAVLVYEFVIDSRWKRAWASNADQTRPSERSRFFYSLALLQLYCIVIGLGAAIYWAIFSVECFSTLLLGMAVAHGCLKGARQLAPIADRDQTDPDKMAKLGLKPMPTDDQVSFAGIVFVGAALVLFMLLCFYYVIFMIRHLPQ